MFSFHSANFLPHVFPPQLHNNISTTANIHPTPISRSISPSQPSPSPSPCLKSNATRRSILLLSTALSLPPPPPSAATTPPLDTTITDRVFLDFSVCPNYFRAQGQTQEPLCSESELMGRVVLGLYGKIVPITVSNFKAMCNGGMGYKNTLIHKVLPGQFFVAGHQGRREKGEVSPPGPMGLRLARNTETIDSKAFTLEHSRPGVVSLCLSENDDDDEIKLDPEYHNVEFLITTGPGPCPQLDGRNIVFGTVLEGMDVVRAIAAAPTYKPAERIRQLNDLAGFLGDERAQIARTFWNRPLKSIYISDCGEFQVTKPSLTPTLP
ncbi:peptidyl-prolyl cis-trans isomerase CYP28, chloroplastic [Amaranthus tricolor]|uniref:peptidyl-prolyl cis-trans isomerase CYP28, chloroplastic n=1 Tax=Amaranthus tricolor TaxID=29722 RepID=UPI00258DC3F3|nr:peptidyl-prolyl cis-trans isomerase CYP28, chloroplastic [Amaranthus tricolor]